MIEAVAIDTGELGPSEVQSRASGDGTPSWTAPPEDLSFEEWSGIGSTLQSVEGSIQWWIGDWLNFGERRYGETYTQAMDATERSYQALADAKWIAGEFEFSCRHENLSWTHHRESASLPHEERADVLSIAENEGWSVRDVRAEVNRRKSAKSIGAPAPNEDCCGIADSADLASTGRKFGAIYADPPWLYDNQGTRAATKNHYDGLTVKELCELPVRELAADDAHLHLWTTNAFLFECPRLFEAWGFELGRPTSGRSPRWELAITGVTATNFY